MSKKIFTVFYLWLSNRSKYTNHKKLQPFNDEKKKTLVVIYLCDGYILLCILSSCVSAHAEAAYGGPCRECLGITSWGIAHLIGLQDSNCIASAKPSPLVIVPGWGTASVMLPSKKILIYTDVVFHFGWLLQIKYIYFQQAVTSSFANILINFVFLLLSFHTLKKYSALIWYADFQLF